MGSAVSVTLAVPKPYMIGRQPIKYYNENLRSKLTYITYLGLNNSNIFKLFEIFLLLNTSETGLTNMIENIDYFRASKFDCRILISSIDSLNETSNNVTFEQWVIMIWNICTLSITQLSQLLYEIYDVDNKGILCKHDIQTMYRMVYDCDDYDEYQISKLPFTEYTTIHSIDTIHTTDSPLLQKSQTLLPPAFPSSSSSSSSHKTIDPLEPQSSSSAAAEAAVAAAVVPAAVVYIIRKEDFTVYCSQHHHMIEPILSFQRRVQGIVLGKG